MFRSKQFRSALKGKAFRKTCVIGTQKSHNVNIKDKEQNKKMMKQKLLQVLLSLEKVVYIILTNNCCPRNE